MLGIARALLLSGLALLLGSPALATVIHGDFFGTNVDFLGVQETSSSGDPEPLYGAPIVIGDSLLFFPTDYTASSAGGGVDQTGAQLQATLMATGSSTLTTFTITEFGDTTLTGPATAATGTFAGIAGFLTVLEVNGIPVVPNILPIPVDDIFFTFPDDPGITSWSLTSTVDIATLAPGATKVFLSFDNNLVAASEAGSSASIQKKVVSGPSIVISMPEPAALVLLATGLAALAWRMREELIG